MNRLLLVLCLLAFAVSGSLGVLIWQSRENVRDLTTRNSALDRQLTSSREQAASFQKQTVALDAQLGFAKTQLATSDSRTTQLTTELAQTKTALAAREQAERTLRDELASLRRDLAEARAVAITPETVAAYKATIGELERQLATAKDGAALPTAAGASTAVFASRAGRSSATIVSVGPESAFVVLNYGSDRGARIGQKFLLRNGSELLGSALISDVRSRFSVAQVEPDSLHGVLHKGDLAVLTP